MEAKEIKLKLGILLQKPESAVDLVIPYNSEKPEKPARPQRAKEIKIKLGILLQKPESAVDLVIPYNSEKPEKPAKPQ
ncbi:Regulator of G-protein signaling 5, partial [Camelus dromedarius]